MEEESCHSLQNGWVKLCGDNHHKIPLEGCHPPLRGGERGQKIFSRRVKRKRNHKPRE